MRHLFVIITIFSHVRSEDAYVRSIKNIDVIWIASDYQRDNQPLFLQSETYDHSIYRVLQNMEELAR